MAAANVVKITSGFRRQWGGMQGPHASLYVALGGAFVSIHERGGDDSGEMVVVEVR